MGFQVEIEGRIYNAVDFSVAEQASPATGDTFGSVGTVDITIPIPDPSAFGVRGGEILSRQNVFLTPRVATGMPTAVTNSGTQSMVVALDAPSGRTEVLRVDSDPGEMNWTGFGNFSTDRMGPDYPLTPIAPNKPLSMSAMIRAEAGSEVLSLAAVFPADFSNIGFAGDTAIASASGDWQEAYMAFGPDEDGVDPIPRGWGFIALLIQTTGAWVEFDQVRIGYDVSEGVFDGWTEDTDMKRYEWVGEPNNSESREFTSVEVKPGEDPLVRFGPQWLIDSRVRLVDTEKGFTLGRIVATSENRENGTITLTCVSRMGELNVYNVQAQPFAGTLEAAFAYYMSLVDVVEDVWVDESIRAREVVFPGWNGELWYYLKQMAAALDCDISLVSGVILVRPIRTRTATRGRDLQRQDSLDALQLAEAVEVYQYNNRLITGREFVYPPFGWNRETEVLSVNPGETQTFTLELSASVSSIDQPVLVTSVPPADRTPTQLGGSVFTAVTDDNSIITPTMWRAGGGSINVEINPDTVSLSVTIKAPAGVRNADRTFSQSVSIALPMKASQDSAEARYSTLRIEGRGVAFRKVKRRLRTGVPAAKAGTEIGATIDNPYISTANQAYSLGARAAKVYSGYDPVISGTVTHINQRDDSGAAQYPTYGEVEDRLADQLGDGFTYDDVETFYAGTGAGDTYGRVQEYWFATLRSAFANQVFGNVNGARIWDKRTNRWYRIKNGTLNPGDVQFQAEDDLTLGDVQELYDSKLSEITSLWSSEFDTDPFDQVNGGGTWAIEGGGTPPTEVRRNLVNPAQWTNRTINASTGALVGAVGYYGLWIEVEPGETYSMRRELPLSDRFRFGFTDTEPGPGVTAFGGNYSGTYDSSEFVEGVVAPANAAYLYVYLQTPNDTTGTPHLLIEQGSTVGPYFDGDTPAAGGLQYVWAGTPNASESIEQIPGFAGDGQLIHTDASGGAKWFTGASAADGDVFSSRVKVAEGTTFGGLVIYSDSLTWANIVIDARNGTGASAGFQIRSGTSTSGVAGVVPIEPIEPDTWYRIEAWTEGTVVQARLFTDDGVLIASASRSFAFPGFSTRYAGVYGYGTVTWDSISVEDRVMATYDDIQEMLDGYSYRQVEMMGLYNG